MSIQSITLTADDLDALPGDVLIRIVGGEAALAEHSNGMRCDASHTAHWRDAVGKRWELPTYLLVVGTRAILWTCTDEAGVADVYVTDAEDPADLDAQVREYAEDIAGNLGA